MAFRRQDPAPQPDHGPYQPEVQLLGGLPDSLMDVPISAVFLTLFTLAAIMHMSLFKRNQIKLHKLFPMNAATFGFCVTRIIANIFRIIWANFPSSIAIGMVAQIFVYAGIPILFVGNLIFAQRIVRAQHPYFGWKKPFSFAMIALIFITVATVVIIIPVVIYGFFTLSPVTAQRVRDVQLFALTTFAITALLPLPIVAASAIARKKSRVITDDFGQGKMWIKILIVSFTAIVLTIGALWRTWTLFMPPVALTDPPAWYFNKWAFFTFNFGIEVLVVYFWLVIRIDQRFYTPDKAKGPYSYAGGFVFAGEAGNAKKDPSNVDPQEMELGRSRSGATSQRTLVRDGNSRRTSVVTWGGPAGRHSMAMTLPHSEMGEPTTHADFLDDAPDYPVTMYGDHPLAEPGRVSGVDHEMGWDRASGTWVLRSLPSRPMSVSSSRPSVVSPRHIVVSLGDDGEPEVAVPSSRQHAEHRIGSSETSTHTLGDDWFSSHVASRESLNAPSEEK